MAEIRVAEQPAAPQGLPGGAVALGSVPDFPFYPAPSSSAGTPPAKVRRMAESLFMQWEAHLRGEPKAALQRLHDLAASDPELANAIAILAERADLLRLRGVVK